MSRKCGPLVAGVMTLVMMSGCGIVEHLADSNDRMSEYLSARARRLRLMQARVAQARAERKEKARSECDCDDDDDDCFLAGCDLDEGELKETLETELNIILENGLELGPAELDFEEIKALARQQEEYDKEYAEARQLWEETEKERRRRHDAAQQATAQARAEAASTRAGGGPCLDVPPDCAFPPPSEYAMAPPPTRRAVGLNEVPIILRAKASMAPNALTYGRSRIRREYLPAEQAKQPCVPRCDQVGCAPPYAPACPNGADDGGHAYYNPRLREPAAAPPPGGQFVTEPDSPTGTERPVIEFDDLRDNKSADGGQTPVEQPAIPENSELSVREREELLRAKLARQGATTPAARPRPMPSANSQVEQAGYEQAQGTRAASQSISVDQVFGDASDSLSQYRWQQPKSH